MENKNISNRESAMQMAHCNRNCANGLEKTNEKSLFRQEKEKRHAADAAKRKRNRESADSKKSAFHSSMPMASVFTILVIR